MAQHFRDLSRRKLYREVAKKHNLLISEVERIVKLQFSFTADVIRSGKMESIRLPKLGRFRVHPLRKKSIDERKANAKKRS